MIEKISMPSSVRLKYIKGTDASGKDLFTTRTINNITQSTADALVYGLKSLLEDVQNSTIAEFTRIDSGKISES